MMPFRPPRLPASTLAGGAPGAICAALFLCFSAAWAQTIPEGYVATREGDVIVMRPSGAADPDVTIRVYPPFADDDDAGAVVRRWAQSHPLAGVDPGALRLQSETLSGVSSLHRIWKNGGQTRQELILMPQVSPGRYQPVVARVPSQPGELLNQQGEAVGRVVALVKVGQFLPNAPADAKGNRAVPAAPVEPTGKRTAPERSASGQTVLAGTQAATGQLARSAAEIETIGFTNRMEMGVGGTFLAKPKPVALFRSGDALLRIESLSRVTSVEADRAAHPKDWGRWKRNAGGIELLQGDKWKKLDYPKTMERLPAGFALSGDYRYVGGGGNTVLGGTEMLATEKRFNFHPDGTYSSNRLSSFSDSGVITRSKNPILEGRYRVDGYLLRLEPAAGQPEIHLISTYPTDPSVLWIDGRGYTRAH